MKTTVEYKINSRVFNEKRRFYGTVKKARNVYTGEFLDIVIRQGSTLTKGDLKVSFEMIMQALITEMLKGNKVFLPIGVFSLGMEGSFESFSDMFTEGRHKFVAKLAASKDMKALLKDQVSAAKFTAEDTVATLKSVTCATYKVEDQVITSGSVLSISGKGMAFDIDDETQGIFLVGSDGKDELRPSIFPEQGGSRLSFVVPKLKKGKEYIVEHRSWSNNTNRLMTTAFPKTLKADVEPVIDVEAEEQAPAKKVAKKKSAKKVSKKTAKKVSRARR